jgi:alkylation response protein AidB-like acyl-CoA dehydrogenase
LHRRSPTAHLRFDGIPATLLVADADNLLRDALDRAIVVLAAEAVGAMGELLRRTAATSRLRANSSEYRSARFRPWPTVSRI